MGQIHELVAQHGRDTARKLVPFEEKRLVDLATEVLTDEKVAAGFTYSGFCMASLPHRSLPDDSQWVRKSEDFSLIIPYVRFASQSKPENLLLLDTSVIVDGRIADLLEESKGTVLTGEWLRSERALEVLERIGDREAKRLLQELATGAPEAWLTREAQATLARLARE